MDYRRAWRQLRIEMKAARDGMNRCFGDNCIRRSEINAWMDRIDEITNEGRRRSMARRTRH